MRQDLAILTAFCSIAALVQLRDYRLYEKVACNFHSDCTVGKILIVAKNSDKWKPFSSPVNATLVLVGVLGECF